MLEGDLDRCPLHANLVPQDVVVCSRRLFPCDLRGILGGVAHHAAEDVGIQALAVGRQRAQPVCEQCPAELWRGSCRLPPRRG